MISLCGGKSLRHAVKTLTLIAALVLTLIAAAPLCRAESGSSDRGPSLDKHARKIHRELTRFRTGSYLRLTLSDSSERIVALDSLEDTSFTVTNAENNTRETHPYAEIERVTHEKDYIGEGSEGREHHVKLWVPIVGVLAAGAALTAVEVR